MPKWGLGKERAKSYKGKEGKRKEREVCVGVEMHVIWRFMYIHICICLI